MVTAPLSLIFSVLLGATVTSAYFGDTARIKQHALITAILFVTTFLLLLFFDHRSSGDRIRPHKSLHRIILIVMPWLLWDGWKYVDYYRFASSTVRDCSIAVSNEYFHPGTIVLGGLADTLCIEGQAKAVSIWGREEYGDVLNKNAGERFQPQFIVMIRELDGISWGIEERYEKYVSQDRKLKTIELLRRKSGSFRVKAEIYRAPDWPAR